MIGERNEKAIRNSHNGLWRLPSQRGWHRLLTLTISSCATSMVLPAIFWPVLIAEEKATEGRTAEIKYGLVHRQHNMI